MPADVKDRIEIRLLESMSRQDFIGSIPTGVRMLEIGPFAFPKFHGELVRYFDVLNAEQIKAECRRLCISSEFTPEKIDYISGEISIGKIPEKFSLVYSSHVIEHTTDIYRHINEVANIIEPDGSYYLAIPDKRYCFDHFKQSTSIGDAIAAYHEQRVDCPLGLWIDRYVRGTHNDAARHWAGDHGPPPPSVQMDKILTALREFNSPDRLAKMAPHLWFLTPDTFRDIMDVGYRLGYIDLRLEAVSRTAQGAAEFYAVFTRRNA